MEQELEKIVMDMCLKMGWNFEKNRDQMRFFLSDTLNLVRQNYSDKLRGAYLKGYDHGMIDGKLNGRPV